MRVIAGKYRGKKLKEFDINTTKPTLDRVKESMFNLIQFEVADAVVLDLFAGTGALGIEALSRGAKIVTFVDKNKKSIELIKSNLVGIDGCYEIEFRDYEDYLKSTDRKFDIVLLDPPFSTDLGLRAIDYLIKNEILNDKGIIIFETSMDKVFSFNYENYEIVKKKYGSVAVYKIMRSI